MTFANLLAMFLTLVVLGVGVVALYDALERVALQWLRQPVSRPQRPPLSHGQQRVATPTIVRSPLH